MEDGEDLEMEWTGTATQVSDSLRSACKVDTDNIEGCRGDTPVDLKMLISPKCFAAGRYPDCGAYPMSRSKS